MKMKVIRFASFCVALVAAVLMTACSSLQPAVNDEFIVNEKYSFGTYSADINASISIADKAVRRACARANLDKKVHDFRTNCLFYKFVDVDEQEMEISLKITDPDEEKADAKSTVHITIKVGGWGDKEASQKMLVAIDEELRLLMGVGIAK